MQPDHKGESRLDRKTLAKIHIAAKEIGIQDDDYRDLLDRVTGKRSARDLAPEDLPGLQRELRRLGWRGWLTARPNVGAPLAAPQGARPCAPTLRERYEELGYDRPDRPNPAQLRKLDALFMTIPGYATINPRAAFRAFLRKRFRVDDAKFLDLRQYEVALKAVREIRRRHGLGD